MALDAIFQPEEYTKVSETVIRFTAKLDRIAGISECECIIPNTEDNIFYPFHPIYVAFKNMYVPILSVHNVPLCCSKLCVLVLCRLRLFST